MAFLKVRNVKGKEDTIINTDLICRIAKSKNGYTVFFSSGNTGAAYYEYDEEKHMRMEREASFEAGLQEGKDRVNKLILKLSEAGRTEDITKAAKDREYQEELFREFGL